MMRIFSFASYVLPLATQCAARSSPIETTTRHIDLFPFEKVQLTDHEFVSRSARDGVDFSQFATRQPSQPIQKRQSKKCKTYPDSVDWPSEMEWHHFNQFLDGALIKTVPEASPCYASNGSVLNSPQCQTLTDNWGNSSLRIEDPTSIRSVLFQGMTCLPPTFTGYFLGLNSSCSVGGYPEYVVKATSVAQIQLAVNFARERNLRLVIKNTGHDFGAKSVGKGSLSIWTHFLKDKKFIEKYETKDYVGPAAKLGAGVQAAEANAFSKEHGVTLIGGEGKTVGLIGGYIQGGGHSPLTSVYGMAADHVLSVELVTADGKFITADESQNSDLFWAVRGGGGSTFGVVTSMVVKAFPKLKVTTMRYNLTTDAKFTHDKFWEMQKAYVDDFTKYADLGYYCYYRIRHVGNEIVHDATSWIAPNTTKETFEASIAPMVAKWKEIGVPFTPIIQEFDNYPDAFTDAFPQEAWTVTMRQASRFFPRQNIANATKRAEVMDSVRGVFDEGANMIMFNMRNPPGAAAINNAVNPAWRDLMMFAIMFVTWNVTDSPSYVETKSRNLTYEWNPRWKKLTPGGGTYMSESDYIEPGWQQSFHGSKYAKLYEIKQKWDPDGVFYAQNAVGSEDWEMSGMLMGHLPNQDSKLCRKAT